MTEQLAFECVPVHGKFDLFCTVCGVKLYIGSFGSKCSLKKEEEKILKEIEKVGISRYFYVDVDIPNWTNHDVKGLLEQSKSKRVKDIYKKYDFFTPVYDGGLFNTKISSGGYEARRVKYREIYLWNNGECLYVDTENIDTGYSGSGYGLSGKSLYKEIYPFILENSVYNVIEKRIDTTSLKNDYNKLNLPEITGKDYDYLRHGDVWIKARTPLNGIESWEEEFAKKEKNCAYIRNAVASSLRQEINKYEKTIDFHASVEQSKLSKINEFNDIINNDKDGDIFTLLTYIFQGEFNAYLDKSTIVLRSPVFDRDEFYEFCKTFLTFNAYIKNITVRLRCERSRPRYDYRLSQTMVDYEYTIKIDNNGSHGWDKCIERKVSHDIALKEKKEKQEELDRIAYAKKKFEKDLDDLVETAEQLGEEYVNKIKNIKIRE